MHELEQRFFDGELDESLRSRLLIALDERRDGRVEFTFNTGDLLLDFDAQVVTLSGLLVSEGEFSLPLADFRSRLREEA